MTKIHLVVRSQENYAKWACLCIESLMRRGGVTPSDVIVSIHSTLLGSRAADVLKSFGVEMRVYRQEDTHWGKFILIDRVFKEHPEVTEVIQVDCDIVLTEDMDFISRFQQFTPEAHMAGYVAPDHPTEKTFMRRSNLYLKEFSPAGCQASRGRLDAQLSAYFGFSLPSFEATLLGVAWVHGGVILVRRSIMSSPAWAAMVAFSWVCVCDETAILLANHYQTLNDPTRPMWVRIPEEYLDHRFNPPVLDLTTGPGLIHFAGDWYRIENEKHRQILTEAFDAL
jgi:hypothetical protein